MARRKIIFHCSYVFTFNIECSSLDHRGQTENELNGGEEDMDIWDQLALLPTASFVRLLTALT